MIVQLDEPLYYKGNVYTEGRLDRHGVIHHEDGSCEVGLCVVLFGEERVVHHDLIPLDPQTQLLSSMASQAVHAVAHAIREEVEGDFEASGEEE